MGQDLLWNGSCERWYSILQLIVTDAIITSPITLLYRDTECMI